MNNDFKLKLTGIWLVVSLMSLVMPVFLPSLNTGSSSFFSSVIGSATASMFILSFPSSIFGLPLLFFTSTALEIDPKSIGGMYLNLFLLFILGLVQWFWIVPRIFGERAVEIQTLKLPLIPNPHLLSTPAKTGFEFFDLDEKTPLERAMQDSDPN